MKSEILEMNNFFILFQNSFIDLQVPSLQNIEKYTLYKIWYELKIAYKLYHKFPSCWKRRDTFILHKQCIQNLKDRLICHNDLYVWSLAFS